MNLNSCLGICWDVNKVGGSLVFEGVLGLYVEGGWGHRVGGKGKGLGSYNEREGDWGHTKGREGRGLGSYIEL